jgi:ubiquinone/menaquinone biosynthesis C-methylase UbiE
MPYGSKSDMEHTLTQRLVTEYSFRSFAELVNLYEGSTRAVPLDLRAKHRIHLSTGVVRAQACLAEIGHLETLSKQGQFLEIGCGLGGFLIAAAQVFRCVVGLDINMPRLVLAKKRLEEAGREAILICAAAEALPFFKESFDLVVGSDVIEHVQEQDRVMHESYRVLTPGGALFLATPNRWSLTPEPHVNVWGVGFLPKAWRARYVWLARKIRYGNVTLLNWFEIRRLLLQTPFDQWRIKPPTIPSEHIASLPAWARAAAPIYHGLKELLLLKWLVYLFGPLFHVICIKKQ